MNGLITGISSIGDAIWGFITELGKDIVSVINAMQDLYNQLDDFNNDLVTMSEAARNGKMYGLPIYQSIGMIRYLIGDMAFKVIYLIVVLGCLFTITQIIIYIIQILVNIIWHANQTAAGYSLKTKLGSLLVKFFIK